MLKLRDYIDDEASILKDEQFPIPVCHPRSNQPAAVVPFWCIAQEYGLTKEEYTPRKKE